MAAALLVAVAAVGLFGASPAFKVGGNSFHDPYWGPPMIPALREFLGARGGGYILPEERARVQVSAAMTGPPDDMLVFEDGARMLSGCRFHSCPEKGAVVLSSANKVQAVGLVNFHCRFVGGAAEMRKPVRERDVDCDDTATLTMFLRPSGAYREAIEQWADREVGHALPREVVWID